MTKTYRVTGDQIDVSTISHSGLSGLTLDDHLQYHTDERGDSRYYTKTFLNTVLNHPSTGVLIGGQVTAVGSPPTTIDIAAGSGLIVNNYGSPTLPTYQAVNWTAKSSVALTYLATAKKTYIGIDGSGNVVQSPGQFSPSEHRLYIILAVVAHAAGSIDAIRNEQHAAFDALARLGDLAHALGQFNINGNVYGPNGANLYINKTQGSSYRLGANFLTDRSAPDVTQDPAATQLSFRYSYRNGSGNFTESASRTTIDPSHYDNGSGTLGTVSVNNWTVQIIQFFSGANQHRIEYGQKVFPSYTDALAAIPIIDHVHNTSYQGEGTVRCYIVVRGGATNLSSASDAGFFEGSKFESGGGVGLPPATGHPYNIFTATAGQTVFDTSFALIPYVPNTRIYVHVFVNGVRQIEGQSFTCTGLQQITFSVGTNLLAGDQVEVVGL